MTRSATLRGFASRCAALVLALVCSADAFAQSTGTLAGRVSEVATGRSLQGAVVRVSGTNAVDYTDSNGRFSISGVPAGERRVEIDYVGLDAIVRTVTVTSGGTATLDASLESKALQMETFTVAETARGQSLAINQQKTAAGIVNIVSEESFGNMISGNPGYALQRLPGISVDEDQDGSPSGINIRGVSGDYNSVQIDGNRVSNPSGTSRSADTKQLVADGITTIEVIKAPTPDRDGDAVGGIINIISRTAFQRDGREIKLSASSSYNELADKWGYNGRLTFSDILGVAGKEKNLGVSLTVTRYTTDRYSENADVDWVSVTAANNPTLRLTNDTKFLEASHSERSFRRTHTTGVNASIDFRFDEHNTVYFKPYFSRYDQNSQTYETDWDIDTRFQDEVGGRKTYAFLSSDGSRGGGTPGASASRSTLGYIGTDDDSHNDLWSYVLGGKYEKDATRVVYDFHYSTSTFVRPNFTEFNFRLDPIAQGYYVMEYDASNRLRPEIRITNGLSPTEIAYARQGPTNLIIVPRTKEEEIYSAKVDWDKVFSGERITNTVKVGAKYRSSKPEFNQEDTRYRIAANSAAANAFPFASVVSPATGDVLGAPRYQLAEPKKALATLGSAGWELLNPASFNGSNLADYRAKEETTAAYAMDTLRYGRTTAIFGLRMERNEWTRTNKKVISRLPGPVLSTESVSSSAKYTQWLPGIHFRHELADNLILRESYNKSYGRPSLNDIARGRSQSVAVNGTITINDGNPALLPLESDNFDIQLEYYTRNGGLYSAGVFYKDITNFTFTDVIRFNTLDAQDQPVPAVGGVNTYNQPKNGPGAKNYGIELIARQRLSFLPGALKGLSPSVSATFTNSEAEVPGRENDDLPLEGFSDYLFTSSLDYAWKGLRARIDYRYRAAYIEGLDDSVQTDEWFSAREQVDAEVSYRLANGITLFATGTNLTHRPQISYTGAPEFPEDISYSGRKFTFGVDYSF